MQLIYSKPTELTLGVLSHFFIAITPRSTLTWTSRVSSLTKINLFKKMFKMINTLALKTLIWQQNLVFTCSKRLNFINVLRVNVLIKFAIILKRINAP